MNQLNRRMDAAALAEVLSQSNHVAQLRVLMMLCLGRCPKTRDGQNRNKNLLI